MDETYFYQERLRSLGIEIDLRDIPEKKYICSFQNLEKIENRIPKFNRSIIFLGKSDYHYLTYIFLKRINIPIILITIDYHFDTKETFENYISCGSWLLEAMKLKNIKKIISINSREDLEKRLKNIVLELPLYVSIDKDILDKCYLDTNWDQGDFSLEDLFKLISSFSCHNIIGIDICGEPSFNIYEYKRSEKINLEILKIIMERNKIKMSA
ncbi:MAG: hypothetical protein NZ841_06085 [Dictyoglomus sp.]|nr:hypothetical protein [Dictyoglomus sp.]MCX7941498.1 hypothetical protein [Dictyoglomaceae bacterium]MDW8188847.1 hypothetical protein [Dictyoglomus sp.]